MRRIIINNMKILKNHPYLYTICSSAILIILCIWIVISLSSKKEKYFEGYIVWGRESIYFVNDIEIYKDNTFKYFGKPILVTNNFLTNQLYEKAYQLRNSDDIRIVKAKFKGYYKDNIKDVPVSPISFDSRVTITNVESSSAFFDDKYFK